MSNRCRRCDREISDPTAQYGWRCAEKLGVPTNKNIGYNEVYEYIKNETDDQFSNNGKLSYDEIVRKAVDLRWESYMTSVLDTQYAYMELNDAQKKHNSLLWEFYDAGLNTAKDLGINLSSVYLELIHKISIQSVSLSTFDGIYAFFPVIKAKKELDKAEFEMSLKQTDYDNAIVDEREYYEDYKKLYNKYSKFLE